MCYKQKCKVVSLNLAHPVVVTAELDTEHPKMFSGALRGKETDNAVNRL